VDSVTRIGEITSSLHAVKHADRRKIILKSIFRAKMPQKHAALLLYNLFTERIKCGQYESMDRCAGRGTDRLLLRIHHG
jgi:hypothetical protein